MAENTNLKTVITKFELTNLDVARATGLDPSLISRYISGNRKLKRSSRQAGDIAEFLMTLADTSERIAEKSGMASRTAGKCRIFHGYHLGVVHEKQYDSVDIPGR